MDGYPLRGGVGTVLGLEEHPSISILSVPNREIWLDSKTLAELRFLRDSAPPIPSPLGERSPSFWSGIEPYVSILRPRGEIAKRQPKEIAAYSQAKSLAPEGTVAQKEQEARRYEGQKRHKGKKYGQKTYRREIIRARKKGEKDAHAADPQGEGYPAERVPILIASTPPRHQAGNQPFIPTLVGNDEQFFPRSLDEQGTAFIEAKRSGHEDLRSLRDDPDTGPGNAIHRPGDIGRMGQTTTGGALEDIEKRMGKIHQRRRLLPLDPQSIFPLKGLDAAVEPKRTADGRFPTAKTSSHVAITEPRRTAQIDETSTESAPHRTNAEGSREGKSHIKQQRGQQGRVDGKEHGLPFRRGWRYSASIMIERLRVGPLGENVYLLPLPSAETDAEKTRPCFLVDPGDEGERILAFMDDHKLEPAWIVCTHGHLDHTAAIPDILAAAAAKGKHIPLAVHPADAAYFGARGEATNRAVFTAINALGYFNNYFRPLPEPELLLEEGDFLPGSTWRVIHTPGHTAGSICLYEADKALLVSGDSLFRDGVGRTDGPDSDTDLLRESIVLKLFTLPIETKVFPGHGEPTSIGREMGETFE